MPATYHIISLGCPKNLVDSERLGAALDRLGLEPAASEEGAGAIIVNTCGFIQEACEESLETVLGLAQQKGGRLLVVAGCLTGRYGESLGPELPEVDLFFGPLTTPEALRSAAQEVASRLGLAGAQPSESPAHRLTPPWRAYVKIAEGCSNRCTYCTIPSIRGRRRSRPPEDILAELSELARSGVREATLVAQDTSAYGGDLRPRASLAGLVEAINDLSVGPEWVRLLYLHPQRVSERLVRAMTSGGRVLPYFDLPVQHASSRLLAAMGRRYSPEEVLRLIESIRKHSPQAALRTSVMVGFPGETERDFAALLKFVKEAAFDHLGSFIFSPEEGTRAAALRPRVSRRVAQRRRDALMGLQAEVSLARHQALVGSELSVLVEEVRDDGRLVGRAARHAPEIDGQVVVRGRARPGELVRVRITGASAYDLEGELVPRP